MRFSSSSDRCKRRATSILSGRPDFGGESSPEEVAGVLPIAPCVPVAAIDPLPENLGYPGSRIMGSGRSESFSFLTIAAVVALSLLSAGPTISSSGDGEETDRLLETASRAIAEERYEDAEAALRRAVDEDRGSPAVHALLGRVLALQDEYLEAEAVLERAVALGGDDMTTLLYLGSARWENGRLEEAEETLRRAVEVAGPRRPLAARQLGRFLLWGGRYEEAIEPLREAAHRYPSASDVLYDLAQALAGAGRSREAVEAYRRVLDEVPDHTRARYGLGLALSALGEHEEATRHLAAYERLYRRDQAETRERRLLEAEIAAARREVQRGEWRAAVTRLSALPETPETLLALATAHRAGGDLDRAVTLLERAVASAPAREDLRRRLRELRLARDGDGLPPGEAW